MANARTITRAALLAIALAALALLAACGGGDDSDEATDIEPANTAVKPAGLRTHLYVGSRGTFEVPLDWMVGGEGPMDGERDEVTLTSPAGSVLYITVDDSVSLEVVSAMPEDEEEIGYMYAQLFPYGPPYGED